MFRFFLPDMTPSMKTKHHLGLIVLKDIVPEAKVIAKLNVFNMYWSVMADRVLIRSGFYICINVGR